MEAALGVRFPEDYRAFLKAYQGGVPVESAFKLDDARMRQSGVGVFLGVDESRDDDFIPSATAQLSEQIPPLVIPIADTGGGDSVMLDLRGPSAKVLYWHHGRNGPNEYTFLADSFTQFIDLLFEPDVEEELKLDRSD